MTISRAGYVRGARLLLLVVAVLIIYGPLAPFPYVQDDWSVLHAVTFTPFVTFLGNAIIPDGSLFYRPLPLAYFSFLHALCGLCPALFHALSLLALILTSLLVVDAGTRLANSTGAGWCAGFLFATAASIHLDTQMWLVGAYEIGALFFALVSVCFFLRGRDAASALSVAAALGCKESAITLPFILIVIWYAAVRTPGRAGVAREFWMRFRAHAGVLLLYAAARAAALLPFELPASHAYAHRLTLPGALNSVRLYAYRTLEALTPLKSAEPSGHAMLTVGGLLLAAMTIALLTATLRARIGNVPSRRHRVLPALIFWTALVIAFPVLAGSMHNAYYVLGALPPLAIAAAMTVEKIVPRAGGRVLLTAAMLLLPLANAVDGSLFIHRKVSLGKEDGRHASSWDGYNHLIRKAGIVSLVWKPLLGLAPSVPPHTVFLFPEIDTGTFRNAAGLQAWYRDSTLRVASLSPGSRVLDGKISLLFPPDDPDGGIGKPGFVEAGQILVFRLVSDSLVRVPPGEYLPRENP